ncbi:MAG: molybdopterin-dependent oxidoreductase [Sulfurospirillaceae bacterium]|nr:molybdopterin-dependent oxidoreductase [Sulfurospirillaceae bacterium]MDD2826465.1 molybdopterin-dependent oxidoreductase [Sulfurospirillaceae bacterium]
MSKTSRRDFLKGAVGSVLGGSILTKTKAEAATVTQVDFGVEKKVPLLCRMCAQFCPMIATVRDGRIVRMEANMDTPYGGICGRGRAAMGALYDPDRIKTPLIRVGERGEGKFRKASWDEVLDLVAGKLKAIEAENDQKSVAFLPRFNSAQELDSNFFKVYGTPNIIGYGDVCFGNGLTVGLSAVVGGKLASGVPDQSTGSVSPDYENAKYGILLQRNPGGALVCHAWGNMFGRGKRNGMQVTVVDPRKPSEAGETDANWVPIRPGTDGPFLLGLMHEIFKNNYFDSAYLAKHTNSDMLIDVKTGLPVQTRQLEKEVKGKKEEILDYLVSTEQGFMFKSEAQTSALFGSFTLDIEGKSVACKTALEMMKEEVKFFTPEWVQEETSIPAQNIIDISKKLNDTKPACFIERGYRSERYASSLREKLLITQINVLLGAFGVKGGVFYNRSVKTTGYMHAPKTKDTSISQWYLKNDINSNFMSDKHYRRTWIKTLLSEKPYKQRVAIFSGQNIVGGSAGSREIIQGLQKLEMIVAISPFLNETIMYADIVMPDCTFMERDEAINTSYKTPIPTIGVNRKAIEPLYESKDGYWIILQLAKRTLKPELFEQYFGEFEREGMMSIWKKQYSKLSGLNEAEMATIPPLESILNGRVWVGEKHYGIKAKGTPTGKIELYSTFLANKKAEFTEKGFDKADYASPLPVYNKPFWIQQKAKLSNNEFIPITGFHPLGTFTGQQTKNNTLLQTINEATNTDAVFINREKGKALKLKTNDIVEIINIDKPEMMNKARVVLSDTVHPDALFCYYGTGAGFYNTMTHFLRNVNKIGFNPNHIANFTFNPLTTGQPAQDFIVSIRKSV